MIQRRRLPGLGKLWVIAPCVVAMAACKGGTAAGGQSSQTSPTAPTATAPPATPPAAAPPAAPPTVAAETPPVLSISIVDAGALLCTFKFATDPNDRWCFGAFGATTGSGRASPSYDYKVMAGATVRAATAGVVTRIDADTNSLYPGEFEVETRTAAGGTYLVIYDHVKNLAVALGSAVVAGTALGTAGIHTSDAAVWGRVELQVALITQRSPTIVTVSTCPRTLGTAAFNAAQDAALAAHNAANPTFASASVCLAETVP